MENKGNSIGLDISLNTLDFNSLSKNKSNLLTNSFVISSYESLYNDSHDLYSYQDNFISFINENNNIIPLTYNLKDENGIFKNLNSYLIGVNIDNNTILDSSILPKQKTIQLTYIYGWNRNEIPMNIIDSYSYIIDSYSYHTQHNNFAYKYEYNYYLYTYYTYEQLTDLGYVHESYTYYPFTYEYRNNDLNIAYSIKYSYEHNTYSYNYSYTYLINQFENNFIFVDQNALNKADNQIGIYKSDLDTMQIVNNNLSVNNKYTDILYKNNIEYYTYIYNNLNEKYKNILLKSSLINSYIFNYKPIADILLSFSKQKDILYIDKNSKKKILNNSSTKININLEEFNLCIPFEYSCKSYIENFNPFSIDKLLINILNKKYVIKGIDDPITHSVGATIPYTINDIPMNVLFNYNNLFDFNFQSDDISTILNTLYNLNYNSLNDIYEILSNNEIELNINKSYLINNIIKNYDVDSELYYGELTYVFNFKINKDKILKKLSNTERFYQFDILMFIKDTVLGIQTNDGNECNHINENYKLVFSFFIDKKENETKYIQTYDILYHDYNIGFNFDKHGQKIGLCFISEGFNKNNPKPVFIKYDKYYFKGINENIINITKEFEIISQNTTNSEFNNDLSDNNMLSNQLGLNIVTKDGNTKTFEYDNNDFYTINVDPTSIQEEYYEDKIYGVKFNYFKKSINLYPDSNNSLAQTFIVDNNDHKIKISDNLYPNYLNKIFNFKNNNNIPSIYKQSILNKYFKSLYNSKTSGIRCGDYYIPTVNEYYIMDLYNILSLYGVKEKYLMSNLFKNTKPILIGTNNDSKITNLYYYPYNRSNNLGDIYILPIFKLPDYSIINKSNYNIVFDNDMNCETIIIKTNYIGFISLNIKQYYKYKNDLYVWYIDCDSTNVSYIEYEIKNEQEIKDNKSDCLDFNIIYQYTNTNSNKILTFNVYYIDSDPLLNTNIYYNKSTNSNINCRILCKVIIKINT